LEGSYEDKESQEEIEVDRKKGATWPTDRLVNALTTKYLALGKDRAAERAKARLNKRSVWYRGKSDLAAMEAAAIRYFRLQDWIWEE